MSIFSTKDLKQFASYERKPTPQENIALLREYGKSTDIIYPLDVTEKYRNRWVAAFDGKLVAADSLTLLLDELRKQEIPPALAAICVVSTASDQFDT